jgi:hypothetical protein
VWLPGALLRRVSDEAPKYGDIIRIHRGDLVPFGNEGRTYRAWDVEVVRKQASTRTSPVPVCRRPRRSLPWRTPTFPSNGLLPCLWAGERRRGPLSVDVRKPSTIRPPFPFLVSASMLRPTTS